MAEGAVSIRDASPTTEDGLAFARYLDVAAEGIFGIMLGRAAPRVIAEAYLSPGHDLSHERVVFAELDGEVVGMWSGYTAEEHRRSSDAPLEQAAGPWRAIRMGIVLWLGRGVMRFLDVVGDGDFYVQAVAVDESQRGAGIGSRLLDHAEDRARARSCRRVVLDVAAGNDAARRLYERRGMRREATSSKILFIPGSAAHRMVKPL